MHSAQLTRARTGPDVETPLQRVSGAMPVGTKQHGSAVTLGSGGDRDGTPTSPSQLRAIRGSKPSKRRSVMDPRRSLVFQGSLGFRASHMLAACPWTGLPPSCPPASSLSLSRSRVCRDTWTIGWSHGRTVIALLVCAPPPRSCSLCPSKVFLSASSPPLGRKSDKASALHSIRPPHGPHGRGLGGPIPAL